MLGFRRGLSTSAKNYGIISSRASLFINEHQKDETKEEKKEKTAHSASVAEDFKTKNPKQIKKKIKIQPFRGEIRQTLWFLMTPSLHRKVKRAHICTLSSYPLLCPQPCCLLDRLVLKQMIIQTMQSEQATGNNALLPQCLHRYFSSLLALWCQVCWKPLTYKRLYIFYISFTQCVPSKSAGSSISEALLWAYCQLGQGQHADTSDLEKRGDAELAELDCKVHTGNSDTTWKDQAASVQNSLQ